MGFRDAWHRVTGDNAQPLTQYNPPPPRVRNKLHKDPPAPKPERSPPRVHNKLKKNPPTNHGRNF